ncbi:sulfotransferase [Cyanobacteria bacterium FACHB-472]|nr:sulfotransferase [Cyanobacteria bacterium FACHB-472]
MLAPQPVFILASPRSFTSLVCAMLGQHPEAYGVPELNLFVTDTLEQFLQRMSGFRRFQLHGLLRTVAQLYGGEQSLYSIEMAHRWISTRLDHSVGEVYRELCEKVAPLRIIDKSPVYAANRATLNRIRKTFPNAYYLHLIRHPRTQGQSLMNVRGGQIMAVMFNSVDRSTNPPTVDPQYKWYRMQSTILDFLSNIPKQQKMHVLGETLLNEPQLYLEKICTWLNFSWNETILEGMLHPEDSPYAKLGPYGAHLGNDPNFLKSPAFRYQPVTPSKLEGSLPWREDGKGFIPEVVKLAQELGYE